MRRFHAYSLLGTSTVAGRPDWQEEASAENSEGKMYNGPGVGLSLEGKEGQWGGSNWTMGEVGENEV